MAIPGDIFKSYDIRAIYPEEINEQNIAQIVTAIYEFLLQKTGKEKLTVGFGYDMRLSAPSLYPIVIETLLDLGADVINMGMVSTPSFYFAVFNHKYDAGIQLTASHNPKEYNGLKIVLQGPSGLIKIGKPTGMEDIKRIAVEGPTLQKAATRGTAKEISGVIEEEVDNALDLLGNPQIKKFKIVADPANAMGSTYIEALFKKVPVDLIKMNFELDGSFPAHQPDPLQFETLVDLQNKVKEEEADLGLAPDGDGDRLMFIDENGKVVPPSIITALVAREFLKMNPGDTVFYDIRYILTPKKIIEESGGKSSITKVGHAFITEAMNNTGGVFAGESSGHYFFRDTGNAENQLPVLLTVLKVMTEENRKLSEIVEELRRSYESGEFNFKVTNAPEIMEELKEKYKDGDINTMDGIAVTYPEWRFSVRTSNTEPLLRLNLESTKEDVMKAKFDEVKQFIESIAKADTTSHGH